MMARAKVRRVETQVVHHINHVYFQTRIAKKRKSEIVGKVVKVILINIITHLLAMEDIKSP